MSTVMRTCTPGNATPIVASSTNRVGKTGLELACTAAEIVRRGAREANRELEARRLRPIDSDSCVEGSADQRVPQRTAA